MSSRHRSRELAMQALFYMDTTSQGKPEEILELFCDNFIPSEKVSSFFLTTVKGVLSFKTEIDLIIKQFSSNWKINRMSGVDRNIIRIAVYELLYCPDIPSKVSINEAIETGKKFGSKKSGAFINGILDGIRIKYEQEISNDTI